MATQITSAKRRLSRYGTKLDKIIEAFKDEGIETTQVSTMSEHIGEIRSTRQMTEGTQANAEQLERDLVLLRKEMGNLDREASEIQDNFEQVKAQTLREEYGAGGLATSYHSMVLRATSLKKDLMRLEATYMFVDARYENMANMSRAVHPAKRADWLRFKNGLYNPRWIRASVDGTLTFIDKILDRINKALAEAEKELHRRDTLWRESQQRSRERQIWEGATAVQELRQTVNKHTDLFEDVVKRLEALEGQRKSSSSPSLMCSGKSSRSSDDNASERMQVTELNDDEYFSKMVAEVSDNTSYSLQNTDPMLPESIPAGEVDAQVKLPARDVMEMMRMRHKSMIATLEDCSVRILGGDPDIKASNPCYFCNTKNDHYHDNCPVVVDIRKREEIIKKQGRCVACLEFCGGSCKEKICSYCLEVYDTAFERIVPKGAHHLALCPLPDKRAEMEASAKEL
ncbi:hypothetical protein GCK32_013585, partial [Trichostrongylus colubriformis]